QSATAHVGPLDRPTPPPPPKLIPPETPRSTNTGFLMKTQPRAAMSACRSAHRYTRESMPAAAAEALRAVKARMNERLRRAFSLGHSGHISRTEDAAGRRRVLYRRQLLRRQRRGDLADHQAERAGADMHGRAVRDAALEDL